MAFIDCPHGSRAPVEAVTSDYYKGGTLPVYQGEVTRHGCPVCAYRRGYNDAAKQIRENLDQLFKCPIDRGHT